MKNTAESPVIVISGATRGIGRAVAERFAREGGRIVALARTPEDLISMKEHFTDHFPRAFLRTYTIDLSVSEHIQVIGDALEKEFGQVDILVNNAGMFAPEQIGIAPPGLLEKMMAINMYAPYHLTRVLLPMMKNRGRGHIFNLCSVASRQAFGDRGLYTITKHALLGFSRALRRELESDGIKVTAILPGPTFTSSWEGSELPAGRIMPPEDVAEAVFSAWLLSPATVVEEIVLRPQTGEF